MALGQFQVTGSKEYLPPTPLLMGFGVLFKVAPACVSAHLRERRNRVDLRAGGADGGSPPPAGGSGGRQPPGARCCLIYTVNAMARSPARGQVARSCMIPLRAWHSGH